MSGNGVLNGDSNGTCYPFSVIDSFAEARENQFMVNGKPLYFNGFNAYWLMCVASDPSTKTKVTNVFQEASKIGMNIVRTWGFSDGGNKPLQTSPGVYNEDMFKVVDLYFFLFFCFLFNMILKFKLILAYSKSTNYY